MLEERRKNRHTSDHRDRRKAESYPLETIIALQQLLANGVPDWMADDELSAEPEAEVTARQASVQREEYPATSAGSPSFFAGLNIIKQAVSEFVSDIVQYFGRRLRRTARRSSAQKAS
jgi:hypothetical protein